VQAELERQSAKELDSLQAKIMEKEREKAAIEANLTSKEQQLRSLLDSYKHLKTLLDTLESKERSLSQEI